VCYHWYIAACLVLLQHMEPNGRALRECCTLALFLGKTGVTADRDKIEFRLFNSSCATARALQKARHQGNSGLQLLSKELDSGD